MKENILVSALIILSIAFAIVTIVCVSNHKTINRLVNTVDRLEEFNDSLQSSNDSLREEISLRDFGTLSNILHTKE